MDKIRPKKPMSVIGEKIIFTIIFRWACVSEYYRIKKHASLWPFYMVWFAFACFGSVSTTILFKRQITRVLIGSLINIVMWLVCSVVFARLRYCVGSVIRSAVAKNLPCLSVLVAQADSASCLVMIISGCSSSYLCDLVLLSLICSVTLISISFSYFWLINIFSTMRVGINISCFKCGIVE